MAPIFADLDPVAVSICGICGLRFLVDRILGFLPRPRLALSHGARDQVHGPAELRLLHAAVHLEGRHVDEAAHEVGPAHGGEVQPPVEDEIAQEGAGVVRLLARDAVALQKAPALHQREYFGRRIGLVAPEPATELWDVLVRFGSERSAGRLALDEGGPAGLGYRREAAYQGDGEDYWGGLWWIKAVRIFRAYP